MDSHICSEEKENEELDLQEGWRIASSGVFLGAMHSSLQASTDKTFFAIGKISLEKLGKHGLSHPLCKPANIGPSL